MSHMFSIEYSARAIKALQKIPQQWRIRIIASIEGLSDNPFLGKKLHGEYDGSFVIRVWPYRIIYNINQRTITVYVVDIGHRQNIYN